MALELVLGILTFLAVAALLGILIYQVTNKQTIEATLSSCFLFFVSGTLVSVETSLTLIVSLVQCST
jgi:high-affinity Fe2+/Pb2+ permease